MWYGRGRVPRVLLYAGTTLCGRRRLAMAEKRPSVENNVYAEDNEWRMIE
jgi:hypothetical protein